jgi:hypothetical protein
MMFRNRLTYFGRRALPGDGDKGGIGVETKDISETAAVGLPANLQGLIASLAGRRRDFEAAQAALDTAESNLRAANQKTADIRNRIAAQERALAESNAPLPESQSADEVRLALAEKHARILALRRDAAREPCEKIRPEIERLKSEIDAAWIEFGRQGYKNALLAYQRTAEALSNRFQEIHAWTATFRTIKGRCPQTLAEDVGTVKPFIHTEDPVWTAQHPADKHPIYLELAKLGAELARAKAEGSATVAQGDGQEEAPTCKG